VPIADFAPLADCPLLAFSGGPFDFDFGALLPAESLDFVSFLELGAVLGVSPGSLALDLVAVLELLGVSLISFTELVFAFLLLDLLISPPPKKCIITQFSIIGSSMVYFDYFNLVLIRSLLVT
jgi:hypothetical protein